MALARLESVSFSYPGGEPALRDVSLAIEPGETIAVLGASGSGKSTLLRALSALVPHFHGGRMAGRVEIAGRDTRVVRPADLAGSVATLFQDPEDQVVLAGVLNEVSFGLENLGVAPAAIVPQALAALEAVGAGHLAGRRTAGLSAGELQRVCLAAALAMRPQLLVLDEPTSQLDPDGAEAVVDLAVASGAAVVVSEQRPALPLDRCGRVLFLEGGRLVLDADRDQALAWLAEHRPEYLPREAVVAGGGQQGAVLCRVRGAAFAYGSEAALTGASLDLRRGEVVALTGSNGAGKTTLAKIAAGLLEATAGTVERRGRAAYLSQDPGRYLVTERVLDEVALGVDGDQLRAAAALAAVGLEGLEDRHPRDLSSGERERVALASVLVTDPEILILDEPTRGVDPPRKEALAELLRRDAGQRATLVVTHDRVFAADVADREVALGVGQAVHA